MKRNALVFIVCVSIGILGVGCGPTTDDPGPSTDEQTSVGTPSETDTSSGDVQDEESPSGEKEAFARNCRTSCSAVRVDTGAACAPVIGFGSTKTFGGCTKACRFARQNAESSAAASGCRLTWCADSCR